ncbi:receptor-like protein EIX1 [Prosopis cineraria]|uniref:receptor-like protein EIX1 n=1 Tax=Prosopis cineraria TaxID=364024 RepID=UPI0024107DD3|nr:receptor-like protein EIX1 [Prosopis cineraria]
MVMASFTSQISLALLMLLFAVTFDKSNCCNDKDRILLLIFKQGVMDPSNLLSSWSTKQDCCQWLGVECDRNTSRVKTLVLPPPDGNLNGSEFLRGDKFHWGHNFKALKLGATLVILNFVELLFKITAQYKKIQTIRSKLKKTMMTLF